MKRDAEGGRNFLLRHFRDLQPDGSLHGLGKGDALTILRLRAVLGRTLGCAGVHWTARALAKANDRPRDLMVGASVHTPDELMRACELDVDFAVLGPVRATPTHPDARPLGFDGVAAAITGTRVPVFALGGLRPDDLAIALAHGAHGIAMRRYAWPPGSSGSGASGVSIR